VGTVMHVFGIWRWNGSTVKTNELLRNFILSGKKEKYILGSETQGCGTWRLYGNIMKTGELF
jgi:hypothetical protein